MRFMMIVKHAEQQGPTPQALMDAIGKLAEEETKAGTMVGSGGLGPTAQGARVRLSGGKLIVTDGPFTETNEVVGGYAQFELKSKEAAMESAVRFMELHKKHWPGWEGETEVRQMFGPEDFGLQGIGAVMNSTGGRQPTPNLTEISRCDSWSSSKPTKESEAGVLPGRKTPRRDGQV